MKNLIMLNCIYILCLLSCNNSIQPIIKKTKEVEIVETSDKNTVSKKTVNPEYYQIMLKTQFSQGGIQGAKLTSSSLLLGEYLDGTESLEFIFKSKMQLENYFEVFEESKSSIKTLEENFECYIFQVNTVLEKHPENEFDLYEYVYPQVVKIFKLENGVWEMKAQNKISTFEELGELKYKTVFGK